MPEIQHNQAAKWYADKNKIALLAAAVIIVVLAVFAFHKRQPSQANSSQANNVTIAPSGIKYPQGWQEVSQVNIADKNAGVISEAAHTNPEASIVVRMDQANLAKGTDIKTLPADITKRLKDSLTGFSLIDSGVINIAKTQAIRVTYKDLNGSLIYEHTQFIIPTKTRTFYLTISAKNSDFAQLTSDITKISEVFTGYVVAYK